MKQHSLVEVFNSLKSPSDPTSCNELKGLLQIRDGCGVQGAQAFPCVFHNKHPAWKQRDGSSCGIFCAIIVVSLVRGLRVHVLHKEIKTWRSFLHHELVKEVDRSIIDVGNV